MRIMMFMLVLFQCLTANSESSFNSKSFYSSKKYLKNIYKEKCNLNNYKKNSICLTIYAKCRFYSLNKKLYIDFKSCNYKPTTKRSKRVEFEHVVPASYIAHQYNLKNRRECSKDKNCKIAMADIKNLYPSIGKINQIRSNYKYCNHINNVINNVYFENGQKCFKIDEKTRKLTLKIYNYMSHKYFN